MRSTSKLLLLACLLSIPAYASFADSFGYFDTSGPLGGRLSHHDLKAIDKATIPLLTDDSLAIGTSRDWSNPGSGDHGTVQLQRRFEYDYEGTKLPCREIRYHIELTSNADPYNYKLNRCKVADGSWKTL